MLLVALTGSIATGKSVVGRFWEQMGCYLFRADQMAHHLMEPGSPAWEKIVTHFGEEVLKSDRRIDRSHLAERVFASPQDREFMNVLIHPLVQQQKKEKIKRLTAEGKFRIFVSEAALTIEAGYASRFHRVVVTVCSPDKQLERLMQRDGLTREAALLRIQSQMPAQEKGEQADYVIRTEGPLTATLEQAERVYRYLSQDYRTWFSPEDDPV